MTLNPGDTLLNGQYRILHPLGRGGFGYVYSAQQQLTGETVAIKELISGLVDDAGVVQRFIQEARASQRLTHPNIVRTHSIFEDGEDYYLVMEYMPGGSLAERLERGRLPVGEALRIMNELCAALGYAHRLGVVHCDLKPANVLFDTQGAAHLADFGIAHISEQLMTRQVYTATGMTMGTMRYMSPEQLEGVRDDPRLDVYALGALLYEMLAGHPYLDFEAETTPAAQVRNMQRIQTEPPRPLRAVSPAVPVWLSSVVERALSKAPQDRYASASELAQALVPREPAPSRPAPLPVWFWPAVGAAVALLLVVVIGFVVLVRDGGEGVLPVATEPTQAAAVEVTATPSAGPTDAPARTLTPTAVLTQAPTQAPATTILPSATWTPVLAPTATLPATETPSPEPMPTATSVPPTRTPTPMPPTHTPTSAPQPVVVFEDSFGGARLDGSKWVGDAGAGEITVADGVVRMWSEGRRFPYIHSQANPFPAQGDFQITYRFRYPWVQDCGAGIIVTSYLVPAGVSQAEAASLQQQAEANGIQAGVWQDRANGLQLWFRSGQDREDVLFPGPNKNWNEMVIRYSGGRYILYLNGSPAYRSEETAHRPRYIWMGHPADLGSNCWWDTLEVDQVRVERLP